MLDYPLTVVDFTVGDKHERRTVVVFSVGRDILYPTLFGKKEDVQLTNKLNDGEYIQSDPKKHSEKILKMLKLTPAHSSPSYSTTAKSVAPSTLISAKQSAPTAKNTSENPASTASTSFYIVCTITLIHKTHLVLQQLI